MLINFVGQWCGSSSEGSYCVINMDKRNDEINGRASFFDKIGGTGYWLGYNLTAAASQGGKIIGKLENPLIYSHGGVLLDDKDYLSLISKIPNFEKETTTDFILDFPNKNKIKGEWTTKFPSGKFQSGTVSITRAVYGGLSKIKHEEMSWSEFKKKALIKSDDLIYRGQAKRWRLQTAFHRTGRADLVAYLDIEIPEVERLVNVFSKHVYDVTNDRALGALMHLIQHHGYPTPLLDWTRSPYVAAFFAFENAEALKKAKSVSIFMFDELKWSKQAGRFAQLRSPAITIRTVELPGYGNLRTLPQQSITMYSNMDDIEAVIKSNEKNEGDLLKAIAIPASERDVAMRDLKLMGITWGSMFPGLDGVCKQLKIKHFES